MRANLATLVDDFRRHGNATAVVTYPGNRRVSTSYGKIAVLAERFAHELKRREIAAGERVLLWGQNSAEWIGAFFGCVLRGVLVVPLDASGSVEFAKRVLDETSPRLVVGDRSLIAGLPDPFLTLAFEDFDNLPPAEHTAVTNSSITLDTPLQILFTSGTTSEPKGVVHTHRNVLASVRPIEIEMQKYLRYERLFHPLRFLHTLPLSHVFGQFMGLWLPPLLGAALHFPPRLIAAELVETVKAERISVIAAVPRLMDLLRAHLIGRFNNVEERIERARTLSVAKKWWLFRDIHKTFGLKFWAFVCGGAALSSEAEQFWLRLGFAVVQGYGMTETTALVSLNHPFKSASGTIGKVMPGREIQLTGEGEILVRGETVAQSV